MFRHFAILSLSLLNVEKQCVLTLFEQATDNLTPYKNAGALNNLDPVIFSLLPKRQISSRYSLQKEFTRTAMEEQLPSEKSNPNRNPNKVSNSANAKKNKKSEFEFCKVCNRNHDEGQRHKYFPSHTKSLSKFLSRVQSKITEIRFFLKDPAILRNEHAFRNRFWCVFCDCDIDELGSYFAWYDYLSLC